MPYRGGTRVWRPEEQGEKTLACNQCNIGSILNVGMRQDSRHLSEVGGFPLLLGFLQYIRPQTPVSAPLRTHLLSSMCLIRNSGKIVFLFNHNVFFKKY